MLTAVYYYYTIHTQVVFYIVPINYYLRRRICMLFWIIYAIVAAATAYAFRDSELSNSYFKLFVFSLWLIILCIMCYGIKQYGPFHGTVLVTWPMIPGKIMAEMKPKE